MQHVSCVGYWGVWGGVGGTVGYWGSNAVLATALGRLGCAAAPSGRDAGAAGHPSPRGSRWAVPRAATVPGATHPTSLTAGGGSLEL